MKIKLICETCDAESPIFQAETNEILPLNGKIKHGWIIKDENIYCRRCNTKQVFYNLEQLVEYIHAKVFLTAGSIEAQNDNHAIQQFKKEKFQKAWRLVKVVAFRKTRISSVIANTLKETRCIY